MKLGKKSVVLYGVAEPSCVEAPSRNVELSSSMMEWRRASPAEARTAAHRWVPGQQLRGLASTRHEFGMRSASTRYLPSIKQASIDDALEPRATASSKRQRRRSCRALGGAVRAAGLAALPDSSGSAAASPGENEEAP